MSAEIHRPYKERGKKGMKKQAKVLLAAAVAAAISGGVVSADTTDLIENGTNAQYIMDYGANKLSNTTESGNKTEATGSLYGNNYYVYLTNSATKLQISNSTFSDNYGSAAKDGAYGGFMMLKGNVEFKDVTFTNNVAESKEKNVFAAGGAVYADSAKNTGISNTGAPNFVITKDTVYSGNTVIPYAGSEGAWYDTYGAVGQSGGGFLYLDREAIAGFDITEGATLTIGNENSTGYMDSIASVIGYNYTNPIINKNGTGTLQMNGDMNSYYGSLNVNAGTMNLAKDWTARNDVKVADGAVLNASNLTLTGLLDGLNFDTVYGTNRNPVSNFKDTVAAGNNGANATTGGFITTEAGSVLTAGKITVNSEHAGMDIKGTIVFDSMDIQKGSVTFGETSHVEADVSELGEGESLVAVDEQSGEPSALKIDNSATINLTGVKKGQTYQLVKGIDTNWQASNISLDNQFLTVDQDKTADGQVTIADEAKNVAEVYGGSTLADKVIQEAATAGTEEAQTFFGQTLADLEEGSRVEAADSVIGMAAMANTAHGTYTMNGIFSDAVSGHLMNCQDQDVWAYGFHSKENVNGLSFGADYDAQYNGIAAGVDFYRKGGTTAGLALIYADSNVSGANSVSSTKNDADYYGVSLYSRFDRGSYALLGDISYMKGDHDITQVNSGETITASPDSDSISVGVKAVKDYAAGENGTLTPYVGLRYLRLSTDDFTNSLGLRYEGDDQDLVIVPVGVNYTASISHGKWSVRPYAGIGYVWTAGDRSTDQTVMLGTAADSFSYDTADSGSFIARAGVATDCGDMSYGIGYSWQKGDSVSNNAWTLSASYHF